MLDPIRRRAAELLRPRPLLPAAAAFVAGRALGEGLSAALLLAAIPGLGLAAAGAAFRPARGRRALLAAGAALAGALLGAAATAPPSADSIETLLRPLGDRPVRLVGRPRGLVRRAEGVGAPRVSVRLEVEELFAGRIRRPLRGSVRLLAPEENAPLLRTSGRIEAWVRLRRGAPARNFGVRPRFRPGSVLAAATAAELVSGRPGRRPVLDRVRERVAEALRLAGGERRLGGGLARALVLGERDELDRDLQERLRAGGTAHVLAVSGLHVAFLTWAAALVAGRLGARPRAEAGVAIATCWGFAALAGFGVPVLRAASLVTAFAGARLLGRELDRWNALSAAVLLSGLLRPADVLGAGWCLTFGATAALLALTGPLCRLLPPPRLVATAALRDAGAVSLAAWLGLLPLQLALFGRVNPAAPLLNLVAVPLAAMATAASLAAVPIACLHPPAAAPCLALVDRIARLLGAVDAGGASWAAGAVPVVAAVLWVLALAGWALLEDPRLRFAAVLLALVAARGIVSAAGGRELDPGVRAAVTVLDVGQGSATLLEFRSADRDRTERWLVDAGGRPGSRRDIGAEVVAPALRALGVVRLDGVIVSHGDRDHVGGMPAVVRAFSPERVIHGPVAADERGRLLELRQAAAGSGASLGLAARGTVLARGLSASWPPRSARERAGLAGNDASVVVRLSVGGQGFAVVAGDVEQRAERLLRLRRAPVLIVPHHGSRTSSGDRLLDAVRPRIAAISAGARNRFGHPHEEVLERLALRRIRTLVTARSGAVRLEWRGRLLHVRLAGSEGGAVLRLDALGGACQDPPP